MATEDAWGLTPVPLDPPAADEELGLTTSEDDDAWAPPPLPLPVTRTAFATTIAIALHGVVRLVVCKTGIHRRRL